MHSSIRFGLMLAAWFCTCGGGLVAAAEALSGSYTIRGTRGAITLVLKQEADGKVTGSLNGGDLSLTLKGLPQAGGGVAGAAATAHGQFASYFQLGRSGGQLHLDLIGANAFNAPDLTKRTRITFPMAAAGGTVPPTGTPSVHTPAVDEPASPAAQAGRGGGKARVETPAGGAVASPAPTLPQGGPSEGADWKLYRHPTGLSMRYPPDWTLTQLPNALQLSPPSVAMNAAGVAEAYFVLAEGAQGITSPEDPRIVQYFSLEMQKFAPMLRSSEKPERVRAGAAPGIVLTWEGSNPAGLALRARMLVTILKGYAVAFLALGERSKIAERDAAVRGMFASFAAGLGDRDPRLVGSWKFWSYSSSPDGRYSSTTDRRFVLQPDGSCFWSSSGESAGSFSGTNSLGETTWTGGVAGQSGGGGKRGQWTAGGGSLHVLWNDGSGSSWDYEVGGVPGNRRLNLKGSGSKPDEWVEGK